MKVVGNVKTSRWCIFCRHWWNPTGAGLSPRNGADAFEIETSLSAKCLLAHYATHAMATCPKFEPKY